VKYRLIVDRVIQEWSRRAAHHGVYVTEAPSIDTRTMLEALCAEIDRWPLAPQDLRPSPMALERASVLCAEAAIEIAKVDCEDPRDRVVEAARTVVKCIGGPCGTSPAQRSLHRLLVTLALLDGRDPCTACETEGGHDGEERGWRLCAVCGGRGTLETA